jgi:hypothetical protein
MFQEDVGELQEPTGEASGKLLQLAALNELVGPDARGAMAEGADGDCGLGRRAEGKVVRPGSAQGGAGKTKSR